MNFLSPIVTTWLFFVVAIVFWVVIGVAVFKLLQVLFKLNRVLDDIQEYIRRRL